MNKESTLTEFVQFAIVELVWGGIGEEDEIVVFATDNAGVRRNLTLLMERLKKLEVSNKNIRVVDIKQGRTQEEISFNFRVISSEIVRILKGERELYLDITHSFRSIPFLSLAGLVYATALSKNSGEKITVLYGAIEALGNIKEVRNMPEKKRKAPIFDLTKYVEYIEWSLAVNEFVRFGYSPSFEKLVSCESEENLVEAFGSVKLLEEAIFYSRCEVIKKIDIEQIRNGIRDLANRFRDINEVWNEFDRKVQSFELDANKRFLAAATWCLEHNLIQQGVTILQEGIISFIISMIQLDDKDRNLRNNISYMLHILGLEERKRRRVWQNLEEDKRNMIEAVISRLYKLNWLESDSYKDGIEAFLSCRKCKLGELAKSYRSLTDIRNDLNHCGVRKNPKPKSVKELRERFKESLNDIEKIIA